MLDLGAEFGRIDIYLFDQLMRKNISAGARVLDAGCGSGRNLVYLLRSDHEVFAVDTNAEAIDDVRKLAAALSPQLPETNFRVEAIEAMTIPDQSVEVVLCSAVLHFARDDEHFWAMVNAMWRALADGGLFFCRLASTIGMEERCRRVEGRRFVSPDGVERYLVDEAMLVDATAKLGGELVDPLKTTVVQDQRCMTTWVVRKKRP
ncbi:MAG: class I SAM-dependent methyltransferase [Vicinamibacteria bacterium]